MQPLTYNSIRKSKKRKVPGYDKISNTALKNRPSNCIIYRTKLINSIFKFNYFSKPWQTLIFSPIPKSRYQYF